MCYYSLPCYLLSRPRIWCRCLVAAIWAICYCMMSDVFYEDWFFKLLASCNENSYVKIVMCFSLAFGSRMFPLTCSVMGMNIMIFKTCFYTFILYISMFSLFLWTFFSFCNCNMCWLLCFMNLLGLQLGIVSDHPDYIMELGLGIQSIGKLRLRIVVDIIYALKRIYFCNEMKREKRLRHTSCVCCGGYGWMFKAIGSEGLTPRSWTDYSFQWWC